VGTFGRLQDLNKFLKNFIGMSTVPHLDFDLHISALVSEAFRGGVQACLLQIAKIESLAALFPESAHPVR
jgi:hypothetical protein